MKKFLNVVLVVFAIFVIGLIVLSIGGLFALINPQQAKLSQPSILHLKLEGIITDEQSILKHLRDHAAKEEIRGVLLDINSPGGVVGASQEIYSELKRVREELKKPVVASCRSMAASGAYYAALSADKIVTNPGTLLGSIGVIMEIPYLEKLYEWAKMDFHVIKTGKYKDAGSPMRPLSEDDRQLFQDLIDEVHRQFKTAVMQGRGLSRDVVDKYSDGRVFNGETAVKLGFADQLGSFEDARRLIGDLSGLGQNPTLFKPREQPESFWDYVQELEGLNPVDRVLAHFKKMDLVGKPLYLMPHAVGL